MKPERWQCIEDLFRTLADRPAADRGVYLACVCSGDEELEREVISLLARDTTEDFIREPIAEVAWSLTAWPGDELTGERIGPYRVTRLIGHGGMGVVYEAERDDRQVRQQVAIKIIRRGMDTDFVRDRFLRERQILASLDHPHIARLFDGGALPDGLPYFVMEFVAGEPITDYCRHRRLSVSEKLKIFRKVCSAVQHAHGRLVIHRDLKPGNILITTDGEPKLLDFGIAELLSPDGSQPQTRTETAVRLMTPEYASPEQARGQAVATTTDVYSLGVVLCELLTGRRPQEFKTYSPAEIERVIGEREPEPPGRSRKSQDKRQKADGSGQRMKGRLLRLPASADCRLPTTGLRGDLDHILLMAMRREPERRYQSVEQFSEDIRRCLAGLPVIARQDTFGYRAGKFLCRHKDGMVSEALRLRRKLFGEEHPDVALSLANPASVLQDLKQNDEAGQRYRQVLTLQHRLPGPEHPWLATTLNNLATLLRDRGEYEEADSLFRRALAGRRKLLGDAHPEVGAGLHSLAVLLFLRGRYAEAEQTERQAIDTCQKSLGPDHWRIQRSRSHLGACLLRLKRYREAEEQLRAGYAGLKAALGDRHAETQKAVTRLIELCEVLGTTEQAGFYRALPHVSPDKSKK